MPHRNLREYFEQTGETQSAFAERLGLSQGYVSHLVAGGRLPSLEVALRVAAAADIPVESLLPARGEKVPA